MLQVHTPNEHWKVIPDTDGMYYISSHGRVYSTKRNILLKQIPNRRGYLQVTLYKKGKSKTSLVHRLVAQAFIHQPYKEQNTVNHIDGDKTNNHIDNLEWVTLQENIDHAFKSGLHGSPKRPVLCVELNTVFKSVNEAGKHLGVSPRNIHNVCNGTRKHTGGYTWKFI